MLRLPLLKKLAQNIILHISDLVQQPSSNNYITFTIFVQLLLSSVQFLNLAQKFMLWT